MIKGVYLNGMLDDWQACFDIRKAVFENELNCKVEKDKEDEAAIQLLLFGEKNTAVASARLIFDIDGAFQFDYLAVLPEARKNGYADFLMHMIFDKARQCGASYLISYDVQHSTDYFKKYGFELEENHMVLDLKKYFDTHKCCHN